MEYSPKVVLFARDSNAIKRIITRDAAATRVKGLF